MAAAGMGAAGAGADEVPLPMRATLRAMVGSLGVSVAPALTRRVTALTVDCGCTMMGMELRRTTFVGDSAGDVGGCTYTTGSAFSAVILSGASPVAGSLPWSLAASAACAPRAPAQTTSTAEASSAEASAAPAAGFAATGELAGASFRGEVGGEAPFARSFSVLAEGLDRRDVVLRRGDFGPFVGDATLALVAESLMISSRCRLTSSRSRWFSARRASTVIVCAPVSYTLLVSLASSFSDAF
mmetsp:Transcript_74039/g.191013  ORF Transcript_74039/g.191013 Transcript_74039/m.191013 type:complete len:242 (-) Transcript_74039:795-1520(-)